jgi:hypothetical protein
MSQPNNNDLPITEECYDVPPSPSPQGLGAGSGLLSVPSSLTAISRRTTIESDDDSIPLHISDVFFPTEPDLRNDQENSVPLPIPPRIVTPFPGVAAVRQALKELYPEHEIAATNILVAFVRIREVRGEPFTEDFTALVDAV